jgi:hypothetical protein
VSPRILTSRHPTLDAGTKTALRPRRMPITHSVEGRNRLARARLTTAGSKRKWERESPTLGSHQPPTAGRHVDRERLPARRPLAPASVARQALAAKFMAQPSAARETSTFKEAASSHTQLFRTAPKARRSDEFCALINEARGVFQRATIVDSRLRQAEKGNEFRAQESHRSFRANCFHLSPVGQFPQSSLSYAYFACSKRSASGTWDRGDGGAGRRAVRLLAFGPDQRDWASRTFQGGSRLDSRLPRPGQFLRPLHASGALQHTITCVPAELRGARPQTLNAAMPVLGRRQSTPFFGIA